MSKTSSKNAFVILFFCLLNAAFPVQAAELSGKISIEPPYPPKKIIKVKKKVKDSCADEQMSKSLLVSSEGGVANTVVWLDGKPAEQASSKETILNQERCNFEPHVVLVPPGGKLKILNSDPLAHDVRVFEEAKMLFRLDMDSMGKAEEESFKKPGIYTVRCGLHPWMHAFIVHAANDYYAVTDENGEFSLKDIAPGKHTLHLWHETLGEVQVPLEVGEQAQNFSYTFKNTVSAQ